MDAARIQAKIYAGRGKAALRIGFSCDVYRPLTAAAPLGNKVGTLKAAFNAGDSTYKAPNLPGDAIWYGDFDARTTQPGDYLVRSTDQSTYFIGTQQPLLPIVCVECNRTLKVSRQQDLTAVGAVGYGGVQSANAVDIIGSNAAMWPASILLGGQRDMTTVKLPGDVKSAGWRILLPSSIPVVIEAGDIATDDLGRRYAVVACEATDFGYRINATELHA